MFLRDFDYDLPDELIARYPSKQRDLSRLLCLHSETSTIAHKYFYEVIDYLNPGDLLVLNNTLVLQARLYGQKKTGGHAEILLERPLDNDYLWLAQIKVSKAPQMNSRIFLKDNQSGTIHADFYITVLENKGNGFFLISLNCNSKTIMDYCGHIPLPPYLQREQNTLDIDRYQTVYASQPGAIAAPTAGLHFNQPLLDKIKAKGVYIHYVTLHVGAGTFTPIRSESITEHKMHHERIEVSKELADAVKCTKKAGNKVVAVGTTTVRSLESAAIEGEIAAFSGESNLFIYPGFNFNVVDAMITNFHLPKSTLLLLVSAFAGTNVILQAYREAVKQKYRFFSYGDAMWLTYNRKANAQ